MNDKERQPEILSDPRFKIFHELMSCKVREILLVSSPYDAWIMEKDRGISEAIVHEYRGLNLSHPPRLHWVASREEAASALQRTAFDLVVCITELSGHNGEGWCNDLQKITGNIPVIRLFHRSPEIATYQLDHNPSLPLLRSFMWNGDTKLFLASIKSIEDQLNVKKDTGLASIRVIIFVEDSPEYLSSLLPVFYQELVIQTQRVMEEGLNEKHRMLAMRVRPKILLASSFEAAMELFEEYEPYVIGVISDVRYKLGGKLDGEAGIRLLRKIHLRRFDIPLLLVSSESVNRQKADSIPAQFVDKNSPTLHQEVRSFFLKKLGFGPFVFRDLEGNEMSRASDLRNFEQGLLALPEKLFFEHWARHDFSRWLFTRGEILLAEEIREVRSEDFGNSLAEMREYLYGKIHSRRMRRQKNELIDFNPDGFDLDSEFLKIGDGSLGGKARGLGFISYWLDQRKHLHAKYQGVDIFVPQTLVITTQCFEQFLHDNDLETVAEQELENEAIISRFLAAEFPDNVKEKLRTYLDNVRYPLAVRSSSLLEDAKYKACAGLYSTYMIANDHGDISVRLEHLIKAIKKIYASTYFREPRTFCRRVGNRIEEEKMAVIIQQAVGRKQHQFFYPAFSGVAQSHNFYPFSRMMPEDGSATIALGLGKAVTEGGKSLRFSPKYPELLPQRSIVDDILKNSQSYFFAIKLGTDDPVPGVDDEVTLCKREVSEAVNEYPVQAVSSSYNIEEHRIRYFISGHGIPVITFDAILKYGAFPLSGLLQDLLKAGEEALRCPVEMEFAVDLAEHAGEKSRLAVLQIRPMGTKEEITSVEIENPTSETCFCISHSALGNMDNSEMCDVVYVKPDTFDPSQTRQIARQISSINGKLYDAGRKYILVGPGRWGSADHWLGIPVSWSDIHGAGTVVETAHSLIHAEPSQGSHFFHNITTLGVSYLNVGDNPQDYLDWDWLKTLENTQELDHVVHAVLPQPINVKVDGRRTMGIILK